MSKVKPDLKTKSNPKVDDKPVVLYIGDKPDIEENNPSGSDKIEKKDIKTSEVKSTDSDGGKASAKEISAKEISAKDPMKDAKRLKILKKLISHLCLLVLVLGIQNIFLGVVAQYYYTDKLHLVLFGGLCIIQVIGAGIGWFAIKLGNRMLFLCLVIINLVWLISVSILLIYYWLIVKSQSFNEEIALHVGAVFFMTASIALGVLCFLMMKQLDMISISYKKPEVHVSAEGKASKLAKNSKT